jgi:protein-arginine deiminase
MLARLRPGPWHLGLLLFLFAACGGSSGAADHADAGPGVEAAPVTPVVDLRADVNRNGTVDLDDPTEDDGEDTWDATHGAIFLANIDDDLNACAAGALSNPDDDVLPLCNDAADEVVNGAEDLKDLARLKTVPWPGAPDDAVGTITVSAAAAPYVRLFLDQGGGTASDFQVFDPASGTLTAAQLRAGVELGLEGKDIVRDAAVWDGFVDVTFTVSGATFAAASDTVRLREAPMITRHHLDPPLRVYASLFGGDADSTAFATDLGAALTTAGVTAPLVDLGTGDQWAQDYFETAYMAMPAPGGLQIIHVNVRSANISDYTPTPQNPLREAGKVVFQLLRGPDVAGVQQFDPNADPNMDSLNSFGNLETIPPYTLNGTSYPLGRIFRGSVPSMHPDQSMLTMFESQQVQPPVYIDTSWLLVGHVDETFTFLSAPQNPRGWTIAVADPTLAKTMLEDAVTAGHGDTLIFTGQSWFDDNMHAFPAQRTISDLLADTAIMTASANASASIAAELAVLQAATGIADDEILHAPVLFELVDGYALAYMVGTVNGISLGAAHFGAPRPHGPVIDGADIFETQLTAELAKVGVAVSWVEDWVDYHAMDGEVHCGSNTTRVVPTSTHWWESGR